MDGCLYFRCVVPQLALKSVGLRAVVDCAIVGMVETRKPKVPKARREGPALNAFEPTRTHARLHRERAHRHERDDDDTRSLDSRFSTSLAVSLMRHTLSSLSRLSTPFAAVESVPRPLLSLSPSSTLRFVPLFSSSLPWPLQRLQRREAAS